MHVFADNLPRVDLAGSRALITGATGGLGAAIARRLHARGAVVLLSGRRADALERLRAELGDRVEVLVADLADREAVAALAERAGKVDVLVANAGIPASGNFTSFDPGRVDRALDVNLRAPMQLALAFAPSMKERGFGHMVFVSSTNGKVATAGSSVYSATKFGMRGFALGLREDLDGTGVGVTTVFPGFIRDAGMFHDSGAKLPFYIRTRTPEHVAKAVSRGIERERLEIDVAPVTLRIGALAAGIAPGPVGAIQRRFGSQSISAAIARGQESKR
jgi:short-subunit dehydrogenase